MDERLVVRWGIGLLTFRWFAFIFYVINNSFLSYYGALVGYYNSNTSSYHYSLIILLTILYSTPNLLISVILLERKGKRHTNFTGMTDYAVYYLIQEFASILNMVMFFYFKLDSSENIRNSALLLFNLLVLVTLGFTVMMMISIFTLPKNLLFNKIKMSFGFWIGFTTLSIFLPLYFNGENIFVRSIYIGILQSFELLFIWYVAKFLLTENNPVNFDY